MASILNTDQEGYRWLDRQDQLPDLTELSDSFGTDKYQHKFFFDPCGFYKIVLNPQILEFANPLLEMKFGEKPNGNSEVFLMWEKQPGAGIAVEDIISDAERLWSMLRSWFERTTGRKLLKREDAAGLLSLLRRNS